MKNLPKRSCPSCGGAFEGTLDKTVEDPITHEKTLLIQLLCMNCINAGLDVDSLTDEQLKSWMQTYGPLSPLVNPDSTIEHAPESL